MNCMKKKKTTIFAACIVLLLSTGTACSGKQPEQTPADLESSVEPGGDTAAPDNTQLPGSADTDSSQTSGGNTASSDGAQGPASSGDTSSPQAQITLEEAKDIALANAGLDASAVTYTKEKLDYEDGIAVYELEFYTASHEYEYEVDASTGAVYSIHSEAHNDGSHFQHSDNTHHSGSTASDIGLESAKAIALEHAGFSTSDVTFKKTEYDVDDGRAVYELEFYKDGREYEYTILASDGTILEYEAD